MSWEDFIHKFVGRIDGGSFQHVALDVERDHALVVLSEWIFRWRPSRRKLSAQLKDDLKAESVKYMRVLDAMDVEMQQLAKLKDHGLVRYRSWKYGFENDHVFAYVSRLFLFWFDYPWAFFPYTFTNYRVISDRWYAIMYTGLRWRQCWRNMPRFSVDQCRLLARNLLEALVYLHANDIVHRHIQPSSVFLDYTGKFVLSDHAIIRKLEHISHYIANNQSGDLSPSSRGCVIGRSIDWLIVWSWLIDWLIDWLTDELIYDRLIDWLAMWSAGLIDWLIILD